MENFFDFLAEALENFSKDIEIKQVGHHFVGDYTVDTTKTLEKGWETAIWKHFDNIIVVQRYPDRESAEIGHKIWRAICAGKPYAAYNLDTKKVEEL